MSMEKCASDPSKMVQLEQLSESIELQTLNGDFRGIIGY
jgi:hypothetical protein